MNSLLVLTAGCVAMVSAVRPSSSRARGDREPSGVRAVAPTVVHILLGRDTDRTVCGTSWVFTRTDADMRVELCEDCQACAFPEGRPADLAG